MVAAFSSSFVRSSAIESSRLRDCFSKLSFALVSDSTFTVSSSTSILTSDFSFSSFCLRRLRFSICSESPWLWSPCFFRMFESVDSWFNVASSNSRRIFAISASRRFETSIWAWVFPAASSRRSANSSSSRDRSARVFSERARAARSVSSSSSTSSQRPWSSLIFFCNWATWACSSSSFWFRAEKSNSAFFSFSSAAALSFSRSIIVSWARRRSPSSFRLARSRSMRAFFSASREISRSSTCCSSFVFDLVRVPTLSSSAWRSDKVDLWASWSDFFSFSNFWIASATEASSSVTFFTLFSVACFSFSTFARVNSRSSMSFFNSEDSSSSLRFLATSSLLTSSSSSNFSWRSRIRVSRSILAAIISSQRPSASSKRAFWDSIFCIISFFSCSRAPACSSSSILRFFSFSRAVLTAS